MVVRHNGFGDHQKNESEVPDQVNTEIFCEKVENMMKNKFRQKLEKTMK